MSTEHDPPTGSPIEPEAMPGAAGEGAGPGPGHGSDDVGTAPAGRPDSRNMLPPRERRRLGAERLLVRVIATCGIVAIGVAIAAIMVSSNSQGWLVGLVVSVVSVVLAAILWSSRQL